MRLSWSAVGVSKKPMRSVVDQYVGAPGLPGDGHVCTDPPGSVCAELVGVNCAIGRSASDGLIVHVPPVLSITGKPFCVRNPPGLPPASGILNRLRTAALALRVRSAMLFSLLRIEWQSAVQPPPCCTNVSSWAYV